MPKELRDISSDVMAQIRQGKLKMHSRWYFILGSLLTIIGLASSVVVSVFFISLTRFVLRTHGPMGTYRLEQLLSSFPWWAPVLAIAGLIIGIKLLRRYDFSYKRKFWTIIIGFIAVIMIAGWIIDATGLNEVWLRHGPMRGILKQYMQENNIKSKQGCTKYYFDRY